MSSPERVPGMAPGRSVQNLCVGFASLFCLVVLPVVAWTYRPVRGC